MPPYGSRPPRPWRTVRVTALRYSARGAADAGRAARRPQPQLVRRTSEVYELARANPHDRSASRDATTEERRARQRLRAQTGRIRSLVNSGADADALDVTPARHRRGVLWSV